MVERVNHDISVTVGMSHVSDDDRFLGPSFGVSTPAEPVPMKVELASQSRTVPSMVTVTHQDPVARSERMVQMACSLAADYHPDDVKIIPVCTVGTEFYKLYPLPHVAAFFDATGALWNEGPIQERAAEYVNKVIEGRRELLRAMEKEDMASIPASIAARNERGDVERKSAALVVFVEFDEECSSELLQVLEDIARHGARLGVYAVVGTDSKIEWTGISDRAHKLSSLVAVESDAFRAGFPGKPVSSMGRGSWLDVGDTVAAAGRSVLGERVAAAESEKSEKLGEVRETRETRESDDGSSS